MRYNYCPNCGTRYNSGASAPYNCDECGEVVYINSKPTSSTVIVDGDRVLLGKRRNEPHKGYWDVIGGFQNLGEHPIACAVREAKEETGYDVEIVDQLGFFMDEYGTDKEPTLNMGFVVHIIGGEPQPGDDIEELQWFNINDIPENVAFDNGKQMLEAWKALTRATK